MSERTTHQKSYLEQKAEKFFDHDSLLSDSDDAMPPTRSSKREKKSTRKNAIPIDLQSLKRSSRKLSSHKEGTLENLKSTRKSNSRSKSRPRNDRSQIRPKSPEAPVNVSTLKDNYSLRMKINELSKTLQKRNKQIKRLYDNIYDEKEQIRQLTHKANDMAVRSNLIEEYEEKMRTLQENELNMARELSEQQKIAKDALAKLYEFQEASMKETESIKKYYRDFYTQQMNEVKEQLEERIALITKEKDNLASTIQNLDNLKEIERNNQALAFNQEIAYLKEQLNNRQADMEGLQQENRDLKQKLRDQEEANLYETTSLKAKIDELSRQSQMLKNSEEEYHIRDANEKTKLLRKVENLEKELAEREQTIRNKDKEYRSQLELINEKVQGLQKEIRKIGEYEMRIEMLEKELSIKENELQLAKQYFKEKLALRKKAQEDQKNEWSEIYNELLTEIKVLKAEINSLVIENKRLVRPFNHL